MRIRTVSLLAVFAACASLAAAQPTPQRCTVTAFERCGAPAGPVRVERPQTVWDPNLAQWRVESPRRVWDPNLAEYRTERRNEVWDPYLAQYRPRDARPDPAPPERPDRHRGR